MSFDANGRDQSARPAPARPWAGALAYAAAWLPLTAVFVALYLAQGSTVAKALRGGLWAVLPVALLGIAVMRSADAMVRGGISPRRRTARHVVQALLFVMAATGLSNGLYLLDLRFAGSTQPYQPSLLILGWQALFNGLVYAALAGLTHARAQARRADAASMRAARAESLRAQADLALLRSQLNPHFVLNVLHSLVGLVRRDPALAERAIEELGGLLGYGLRMSRQEHDRAALRDEWSFVESYLDLEKMRLGDRLELRLACDPETLDLGVPTFALQPLVENAVVHAIAPRARGGRLEVRARISGDRLRLEVQDDGPGLPTGEPGSDGLGLKLLRERLAALYPEREVLRLVTAPGGGLLVSLELPIEPMPAGVAAPVGRT